MNVIKEIVDNGCGDYCAEIEEAPMMPIRGGQGVLHGTLKKGKVDDWRMAIEANGVLRDITEASSEVLGQSPFAIRFMFDDIGLEWTVQTERQGDALIVVSTLRNRSKIAIRLGKACLFNAPLPAGFAMRDDDVVCLDLTGAIFGRMVRSLGAEETPTTSKIKFQFYNRTRKKALQVGFLTFQRADTEVEYDYGSAEGITRLRASCNYAGWQLAPGAETQTERFILSMGEDPSEQLISWADQAALLCGPRDWEDAPIGWLGWAWVDPFSDEESYQEIVIRNCKAINERLKGFGVNYVWLSIGNIEGGYPGNWLQWNTHRFPDGPAYLNASLREMGFRMGLWCGLFYLSSNLEDKVAEYKDALLRDADGELLVVQPQWRYGDAGDMPDSQRPCIYAFDPSHPKTHDWLRETFETYRKWGVRYYMIDFLEAGAGITSRYPYSDHHDQSLVAGPEAYHRTLRVVREAAGDDTYFLSSSGPTIHNAGMVDAARVGNDFGEGRSIAPNTWSYPASISINRTGEWAEARRALTNQASAWYTHRRLYINDSGNVLTVDKPITLSNAQIHATIHALSGGPTMIGDDVDRMAPERLALIKKTLPRPRDVATPVDLWDVVHPEYPRIFHRRVEKPWGRFDVVAVYNMDEEPITRTIDLVRLGLSPTADYLTWEFWNEEYVGRVSGQLKVKVPDNSVRVLRLVEDTGVPTLLGTDMHLLMGEMDIESCEWNAKSMGFSVRATRPVGECGSVFIWAPPGLNVINTSGHWLAKDVRDSSLLIRVALKFDDVAAGWNIRFARLDAPGDSFTDDR